MVGRMRYKCDLGTKTEAGMPDKISEARERQQQLSGVQCQRLEPLSTDHPGFERFLFVL